MSAYVLLVVFASPLLAWVSYLVFCGWLVRKTGDPKSLTHAANIAKAFRGAAVLALGELLKALVAGRGGR